MPYLDGFQVLELMRNDPDTTDIPVIFVSAFMISETNISSGIDKGAIDFIAKPVSGVILRSKVKSYLQLFERKRNIQS